MSFLRRQESSATLMEMDPSFRWDDKKFMSKQFDYEKFDVFPVAVELMALIDETVHLMPRGGGEIADLLQQNARSIPLNLAAGTTEVTKERKLQCYYDARRSTIQCAAMVDVCNRLELVDQDHLFANRDLLHRVLDMMTKLIEIEQEE